MNNSADKEINWRKRIWLGVLVAVLIYGFGEPYLEQWLGIDLPSIRENGSTVASSTDAESGEPTPVKKSTSAAKDHRDVQVDGDFLKPTGKKNRLRSPAGLIYGESRGEHRVDHVLRHAKDDPNRQRHSVFTGNRTEILELIDEAYELVKSNSDRVLTQADKKLEFRVAYTVDMQRKVGYFGGIDGKRQNYPPRSRLKLVVDNGKFIVTAYPSR